MGMGGRGPQRGQWGPPKRSAFLFHHFFPYFTCEVLNFRLDGLSRYWVKLGASYTGFCYSPIENPIFPYDEDSSACFERPDLNQNIFQQLAPFLR